MTDRLAAYKRREVSIDTSSGSTRLPVRDAIQGNAPIEEETSSTGMIPLETLLEQVRDLPMLPAVALKVMRLTQNEVASTREIGKTIAQDPSFTARILRLANSAFYGLPRTVSTISEAVTMLGNRTIRHMAIVAATHDTLRHEVIGYELGQGDLWRHSLSCGIACQFLASQTKYADPEEAFVAGLLHDVGKVILGRHVGHAIQPIQEWMETNDATFLEAEHAVLGYNHAEVGGRVALRWNLPTALVQAIAWHHEPVQNGQISPLATLVHVADVICLTAGLGLGADGLRVRVSSDALSALKLEQESMEAAMDCVLSRVAEAQPLFELHTLM